MYKITTICRMHWQDHATRLGILCNLHCRNCVKEGETFRNFLCDCPSLNRAKLQTLGKLSHRNLWMQDEEANSENLNQLDTVFLAFTTTVLALEVCDIKTVHHSAILPSDMIYQYIR